MPNCFVFVSVFLYFFLWQLNLGISEDKSVHKWRVNVFIDCGNLVVEHLFPCGCLGAGLPLCELLPVTEVAMLFVTKSSTIEE